MSVRPGKKYRHYKGGFYYVLYMALHTETDEQMVVYQAAQGGQIFCRPLAMFVENVTTPDYQGPRFVLQD